MKKKVYEKPQMKAVEIQSEGMLCLSDQIQTTSADDFGDSFTLTGENGF